MDSRIEGSQEAPIIVVLVPFPTQSHLNQVLQLSCLIASHKIPVHFISFDTNNQQVKHRALGLNPQYINQIQFHDIPPPSIPSLSPIPGNDFPAHLLPIYDASLHLREHVTTIVKELSHVSKKVIIIHDSLTTSNVQDVDTITNVETYVYRSFSALATFYILLETSSKHFQSKVEIPKGLPSFDGCLPNEVMNFIGFQQQVLQNKHRHGYLFNTCRSIEGNYLDLIAKERKIDPKKVWAVGPLNLVDINSLRSINTHHECFEWLDMQPPKSVLFICFGTTISIADEQINELAIGLEESMVSFLWVLKDADKANVFAGNEEKRARFLQGFEKRVKGKGLVVRDWVPQVNVLAHPSIGGFMSHCGWGSCIESISVGVPIAAWPIHSEQPQNGYLIANVLKAGLVVKQWECREKLVLSSCIKESIIKLMASKEGEKMRKRAEELGCILQDSRKEGGVSHQEFEYFISYITR